MAARFALGLLLSEPVLAARRMSRIRGRGRDELDLGVLAPLPSSSSSEKNVPLLGENWRLLLTAERLPAGIDPSSSAAAEQKSPSGAARGEAICWGAGLGRRRCVFWRAPVEAPRVHALSRAKGNT
mmetsp:Transcript_31673/g.98780  ORF Transcript_31673/g.98780 Transcript_31673/m.98780 type:complete len:126 (+) Transcript_31673:1832-2209(+)